MFILLHIDRLNIRTNLYEVYHAITIWGDLSRMMNTAKVTIDNAIRARYVYT